MNRADFIQGVVRTRVLEKRLITKDKFEQMINAPDIKDVFKILSGTEYQNHYGKISSFEEYEKVLSAELKRVYTRMREISPEDYIIALAALKYDFHNLKVLLKEKIMDTDFSRLFIPVGVYDFEQIKKQRLPDGLNGTHPELQAIIAEVMKDYETFNDPQRIDILLDRMYADRMYDMAISSGVPLFVEYVKALIDFNNFRTVLRIQKQGEDIKFLGEVLLDHGNIEKEKFLYSFHDNISKFLYKLRNEKTGKALTGGLEAYLKTNRPADLEKKLDDFIMDILEPAKYIHFGPEPLFAYILAKEREIQNLRFIFVSKFKQLPPAEIRKRVRKIHA